MLHTSIELLDNTSEVNVSLQEISNKFEIFPWGEKEKKKVTVKCDNYYTVIIQLLHIQLCETISQAYG